MHTLQYAPTLLPLIPLSVSAAPTPRRSLRIDVLNSGHPGVRLVHELLLPGEAERLIELGKPLLTPSPTVATYRATLRTSSTAYLINTTDPTVAAVRRR